MYMCMYDYFLILNEFFDSELELLSTELQTLSVIDPSLKSEKAHR